ISRWNLLRHDAKPGQHLAGDAANPELETSQIVDCLDLLPEPTAHLRGRVAERQAVDAVGLVELVEQIEAAAIGKPRVHLPRVEPERNGRAEGKGQILADVIVGSAVSHLDRV